MFDEFERVAPSPHPTLRAELSWLQPDDEQAVYGLFDDPAYGAENWTSSVEVLCAQCSRSSGHVHGPEEDGEVRLTGTWGFGGDVAGIRAMLETWSAAGSGRSAPDPVIAEPD